MHAGRLQGWWVNMRRSEPELGACMQWHDTRAAPSPTLSPCAQAYIRQEVAGPPLLLTRPSSHAVLLPTSLQAYIRQEIAGFVPKPSDLDYPERLQRAQQAQHADQQQQQQPAEGAGDAAAAAAAAAEAAAAAGEAGGAEEALPVSTTNGAATGEAAAASGGADADAGWYPPVQRCVLLLGKLYRGLDARIFNGLAHEAVLAATAAVQDGARAILKVRPGLDPEAVPACLWPRKLAQQLALPRAGRKPCAAGATTGAEARLAHARLPPARHPSPLPLPTPLPGQTEGLTDSQPSDTPPSPPAHPLCSPSLGRPGASPTPSCLPSASCWRCASSWRRSRPTLRWWSATWVRQRLGVAVCPCDGGFGRGRRFGRRLRALPCSRPPVAPAGLATHAHHVLFPLCTSPPPDFSHMRDYLRRTLSGQLPLFSLGADNAVVQVGPRARAGCAWMEARAPLWVGRRPPVGAPLTARAARVPRRCVPLARVPKPPACPPAPTALPIAAAAGQGRAAHCGEPGGLQEGAAALRD